MKRTLLHTSLLSFFSLLLCASAAHAQVMSGCNDPAGGIQIHFDYNLNCPNSPGSLAGLSEIGFHSGANGWASVVAWDAAGATHGVNQGNNVFVVDLPDPNAYYGTTVTALNFVFNQGASNPADPWGSEGKADSGTGTCNDFYIELASITQTCATTGVPALLLDKTLSIFPNPVTDAAVIRFENAARETFDIKIRNSFGQLVEEHNQFDGEELVFHKNGLASGFYYVTLSDQQGKITSRQMVIR